MAAMNMVREGFLYCQCCAPKGTATDLVESFVNQVNPTGIDSKWRVDASQGEVQCEKHPENIHVVLSC